MNDFVLLLLVLLLYFPLTILINRIQLSLFPRRKSLPAQGTIARSAVLALVLLLPLNCLLLGNSLSEKFLWLAYSAIILGCLMLLYISVMCVSESGRRFYFMVLIEKAGSTSMETLQAAYGREHMLAVRLDRLTTWGVFRKSGDAYFLQRRPAYWYSRFFQIWGRVLGFDWFKAK